jgi:hypothetical protein|tara:strand:- start:186 stop:482 length:297 start_codon:yes stop_codon:yes gene_type:complete
VRASAIPKAPSETSQKNADLEATREPENVAAATQRSTSAPSPPAGLGFVRVRACGDVTEGTRERGPRQLAFSPSQQLLPKFRFAFFLFRTFCAEKALR